MTSIYKNTFISSLMMIVMALAAWTTLSNRPHNVILTPTVALPDAYMENVTALIMNKQGDMHMKIVAPKMTHYAENDTTLLTTPVVTLYRQSPQPWYVTANYAKATQGTDYVNFWDNVIIHRAADSENPATIIKTATLRVQPNKQIAETNEFITLIQPNTIVKATGMYADMNTGNIKLLSQARGEYVPSS